MLGLIEEESHWRNMIGALYGYYSNSDNGIDRDDGNLMIPLWMYYNKCFSESYFTVKGTALILPQNDDTIFARRVTKSQGGDDIQSHLQAMFSTLRPQDTIKVAVKLEGDHNRYLAVVSCIGRQDTEESVILGMDLIDKAYIGLVLPVWAHTHIKLDGDGGFTIQSDTSNIHTFKPVSVQAMWSALQSLNKVVKIAKDQLYIPRGLSHTWVSFYQAKITDKSFLVSEWNASVDRDNSYRQDKTMLAENAAEEDIYQKIKLELKNVMMTVDLEEVTCFTLRKSIEEVLGMDLKQYKSFIDTQMMEILGQMDAPSLILDYLYLGSEWNASNLEELQNNGVQHILNISREIDNFYPGILHYMNVREWDVESSDLMKYWEDTHKFINKARKRGSKALVHCKMGISRSASTVIAYLMKERRWTLQEAFDFTKSKRSIINPNPGFMKQLETYQGILTASWKREQFEKFESGVPSKPISQIDEADEIPDIQCFQGPEDLLAAKLGSMDGSDFPYLHSEHDIDMASRSADSTEDSLIDTNLSPETTSKHAYKKSQKLKNESGDYVSSDSSGFTDSDDFSTDEDNEETNRASSGFIPIQVAQVDVDEVDTVVRKKPMKTEARRVCKSESDKNLLAVEDQPAPCSREGSVTKFRADGSWIKPPDEDDIDALDNEMEGRNIDKTDDCKMEAETVNREEGLWMDICNESEMAVESGIVAKSENDKNVLEFSTDDKGDQYTRENIPWNPGTVLKQKEDIERYGSFSGSLPSACKNEKTDSDTDAKTDETQDNAIKVSSPKQPIIVVEAENQSNESCDQSGKSIIDVNQSGTCSDSDGGEPIKKSVYEEEEIDLPEGIVRKTKMEIEERNRLSLESPRSKLKRSSSMKTCRVTPKSKNRDSERRKTCIALLSPTHPDYTEFDQTGSLDLQLTPVEPRKSLSATGSLDHPGATGSLSLVEAGNVKASTDSDEESLKSGSVKVYKFMGEELTVEEGLVRKQTQDIENKAVEVLPRQQKKGESSPVNLEQCSPKPDSAHEIKQMYHDSSDESSLDSHKTGKSSVLSSGKSDCVVADDNLAGNIHVCKYDTPVPVNSPNIVGQKKPASSRPESRFDPETLALIREIGSAILNSPAKAELEEQEDSDLKEGESLVNHYVRKIEKTIKTKPHVKRIVIIDKDNKGSYRDKSRSFSPVTPTSPKSDPDTKPVTSKWSPVARKQTFSPQGDKNKTPSSDEKPTSPKWCQMSKTSASPKIIQDCDEKSVADAKSVKLEQKFPIKSPSNVCSEISESPKSKESSKETCSVKDLCGKFELPDLAAGKITPYQSPLLNTPPSAGARLESGGFELASASGVTVTLKGQHADDDTQCLAKSPKMQRHSEPTILLNLDSVRMLEGKLREMGTSIFTEKGETESSNVQLHDKTDQSRKSAVRPKSAGQGHAGQGHAGQNRGDRSSRSLGASSGCGFLQQSQSMLESESQDQAFTWDGKKVRKSYGKSHPLAKLENRQYMESGRKNPFYSTM